MFRTETWSLGAGREAPTEKSCSAGETLLSENLREQRESPGARGSESTMMTSRMSSTGMTGAGVSTDSTASATSGGGGGLPVQSNPTTVGMMSFAKSRATGAGALGAFTPFRTP